MRLNCCCKSYFRLVIGLLALFSAHSACSADAARTLVFTGVLSEQKIALQDFSPALPADWTPYTHLVLEMRTSSPQRFGLWLYTHDGVRRIEIQPFGQNVWLRASIPLRYFQGMDQSGTDLASSINRRTNSFWMSVWGPFGSLDSVQALGFAMEYPINAPKIEIRSVHLSHQDEGSDFLDAQPVRDAFGQWAVGDWPRKIKSQAQLDREMAAEAQSFKHAADFGYDRYGGYKGTQASATGFFRVSQINGKWWFVDPDGHLFLSTGINGTGGGPNVPTAAANLMARRLESWGLTTGGVGRPNTVFLRWPGARETTFLGVPDVYADAFAQGIDAAAATQCAPRKNDPFVLGYFIGNEPPWGGRESEVVDLILAGPETATKARLQSFLAAGDTPQRRKQFVTTAFAKYLDLVCTAVRKYDPNHLILGIRFGGTPSEDVLRAGRLFDVCSINVYEYEPTKQVMRAYRLTGRPILIGEFHLGVPENGLGSGLVQAENQKERGVGYRYYLEQAASLDSFLGAHWFQWRDEPVLGRMDGENYNIGFVDVTDRPYPEMVSAAQATARRLFAVHAGTLPPFAQKPKASDAGTPSSPWDNY